MKPIIYLLSIMLLVASCSKDDTITVKPFKVNANDKISISPASGVRSATIGHLSALEIVKQAHHFRYNYNGIKWEAGFASKDSTSSIPKLFFWAQYVIAVDGTMALQEDVIASTDVVLVTQRGSYPTYINDTIAYIPNATLRTAETAIRAAYAAKDIDACFKLFDEAYTFTPITGAEWRELKAQGAN